jgi:hypothetical protein
VLGGVTATASYTLGFFQRSTVSCDVDPALVGVGYIIGYRTSVMMVAGSILAAFILTPLILLFGAGNATAFPPGTMPIGQMDPDGARRRLGIYIRTSAPARSRPAASSR